ncbi:MAG: hypothetical protein R6W77_08520, partial [Trueperaceae bacterium]
MPSLPRSLRFVRYESASGATSRRLDIAFDASAVVLLQFLVLLLPRDVAFMPIIYASPWLTTAALVAFGFRVSRRALAMLAAIVTISVLV